MGRLCSPLTAAGCQVVTGRFSRPDSSSTTAAACPATNATSASESSTVIPASPSARSATADRSCSSHGGAVTRDHDVDLTGVQGSARR